MNRGHTKRRNRKDKMRLGLYEHGHGMEIIRGSLAEAGKIIKMGHNDTMGENAHCGTKSAPGRGRESGRWWKEGKKHFKVRHRTTCIYREQRRAYDAITPHVGKVDHLVEIAKDCRDQTPGTPRNSSILLDFLDIARSSSICLAGFFTGNIQPRLQCAARSFGNWIDLIRFRPLFTKLNDNFCRQVHVYLQLKYKLNVAQKLAHRQKLLDASLNDPEDEIESSSLSYRGSPSFASARARPVCGAPVSGSRASGNGRSLRRSEEMSAYAQSNEAPLHIGLLWFLNVHAPPPYRWQRCQALLYPHLLLLSWLAPGGGRGIAGLDLINCQSVQSTPGLGHPAAREDAGSVAAMEQSEGEQGQAAHTLVDLLVPFQIVYEDGVERLAAESLLERQNWVTRIREASHRPLALAESVAGLSAGDANEDANESTSASAHRETMPARTASICTILSVDCASSVGRNGSRGSRSTVFVPPMGELKDIRSESGSETETGVSSGRGGPFTPTTAARRTGTVRYNPSGTGGMGTGTGTTRAGPSRLTRSREIRRRPGLGLRRRAPSSPIGSGPPSTTWEAPSELSSMPETLLTSTSSYLTPPSRALSSLHSWGRGSSGTYESSILAPSPSIGSIPLHDTSGETSFLRPTESFSSGDRMSTIPRSTPSELTLPSPPSSSLSDVSDFPSESSSSIGSALPVLTQSSEESAAGLLPETTPPEEEPATTSLLSTPRPSRPPSSVAASNRSLRTPETSGSMSVSTPRGDQPSEHSMLVTIPSYRAPSTHGVALEHLANELRRLADIRGEQNQDIVGNVRALRNELRDFADFLHRPASRAPSPMPRGPSPTPAASTPGPAQPRIQYLEPSITYTGSLSRSASNASIVLSTPHSHDVLWSADPESPLPDSLYPGLPRQLSDDGSTPDYSPPMTDRYSTSTLLTGSPETAGLPFLPSSPSLSTSSSSSSSTSSSSTDTVTPNNVPEDIRRTVDGLADSAANYGPLLDSTREMVVGLWQGQLSTNHSLDWFREHHVPRNTELNERMARIEDILHSIIDRPGEAPQLSVRGPGPVPINFWRSILRRPAPDVPEVRMPVPPAPAGRTFAQQLDDILLSAGSGVPLEPAERPRPVVPFQYDVQGRGLRPRSGVGVTVPPGPARPYTIPLRTTRILWDPRIPRQNFRDGPGLAGPSGPSEQDTQPGLPSGPLSGPAPPPQQRLVDPGPPQPPIDLHGVGPRPQTALDQFGGLGPSTYRQAPSPERRQPTPGMGVLPQFLMLSPPTTVNLFDSLTDILRGNRLAQLATVDQQRELMRYMRGLNEWLPRDVHDRQAALQGVIARVERLSANIQTMAARGAPGSPGDSDSSSSSSEGEGGNGPPAFIPTERPSPVIPPEPWRPPPGFRPHPFASVIPLVFPNEDRRFFIPQNNITAPLFIPQFPRHFPQQEWPILPFRPPNRSDIDPIVFHVATNGRSSSSGGQERLPRRRIRRRGGRSSQRTILVQPQQSTGIIPQPVVMAATTTEFPQQQQPPPPQTIVIQQPAPPQQQPYMPQGSMAPPSIMFQRLAQAQSSA
ncbi:hypothetical protein B0H13DRAFT_2411739 [Mycena leptocephala]|nr:hypothetical protein B0H13DRAFT_2411739 [Mycena leptocephala]